MWTPYSRAHLPCHFSKIPQPVAVLYLSTILLAHSLFYYVPHALNAPQLTTLNSLLQVSSLPQQSSQVWSGSLSLPWRLALLCLLLLGVHGLLQRLSGGHRGKVLREVGYRGQLLRPGPLYLAAQDATCSLMMGVDRQMVVVPPVVNRSEVAATQLHGTSLAA